jgi:hypothetical protein
MKSKVYLLLGLMITLGFTSCEKEDDILASQVPANVMSVFQADYTNVFYAEWERHSVGGVRYYKAEFLNNDDGLITDVWYTSGAVWRMTEVNLPYRLVPEAVLTSLRSGEYASWYPDDSTIDRIERAAAGGGIETLYVIDVERGEAEQDLVYTPDGTFVRAFSDRGNDDNSALLP